MFQIISIALIAITSVIVIANVLMGIFRGLKQSIGSLVAVILSAAMAAIITAFVCTPNSGIITWGIDTIKGLLGQGALQDIFAIEALGESIAHYVSMLISPIFFWVVYLVLSFISTIVVGIITKFAIPKFEMHAAANRLGGLGVALICALIVNVIVVMPFVGMLDIASDVAGVLKVEQSSAEQNAEKKEEKAPVSAAQIEAILGDTSNTLIIDVYNVGCGWMYDTFASTVFDGERVYLREDVTSLVSIVNDVTKLGGDMSGYGEEQINSIYDLVDQVDHSPLLKHMVAGVISNVSSKWMNGETFLGIAKFSAGELLDPMIDTMLEVLSTSTHKTVGEDLHTMADIFNILIKHDLFSNNEDYGDMLEKLSKDGVVEELIVTANENPRMSVMSDQITQLSIRALASTIGIPKDAEERYHMIMDDIAKIVNDSASKSDAERQKYVEEHVKTALDDYGVKADGDAAEHIAASIIEDLGDKGEIEGSDVEEFFLIYAIAESADEGAYTKYGVGFDNIASDAGSITVNGDGTISINGRVLKNYKAGDYKNSAAYTMGHDHVYIGDAKTLYSADAMRSSLVTLNEIVNKLKKFSDCEDASLEAEKIAEMLAAASELFAGSDFENMSYTEIIGKMGDLLDKMDDTEIFGTGAVNDLLKAMIQSQHVRDELGLSNAEATDFADKMNNMVGSTDHTFSDATQTITDTMDMIDSINNKDMTDEERADITSNLISNMTSEKADLLGSMVTPSLVEKYGSSSEKSETVSSSVSNLFNNMADYTDSSSATASDSDYKREADAVNKVLQLAMDGANSDDKALFSVNGEDGKINSTPEEFVELLVTSKVVSKTLNETVYDNGNNDNPYGVNTKAEDAEMLSAAILGYYEDNKTGDQAKDEELVKTLNAIAVITNIESPLTQSGN